MPLILSKKGFGTQKLERSDFDLENDLQDYIHHNPDAIPVYELQEDKRLFVLKREFPTSSGPIDALAVDQDGEIYIMETKLYKNPDKRTVVAQALDYGAALWKHSGDQTQLLSILETEEMQQKFKLSLFSKLSEFYGLDTEEAESLIETIQQNLASGNLKFVIIMNTLSESLKDLILYVNQNSQFDIYAVQMEYYRFDEYELTIPKIFGGEVKKNVTSTTAGSQNRRKWNEESFIEQVKSNLGPNSDTILKLYDYFKDRADKINFGTGAVNCSFNPIIKKFHPRFGIFTIFSNGQVKLKFNWILENPSLENEEIVNQTKKLDQIFSEKISQAGIQIRGDTISSENVLKHFDLVFEAIRLVVENVQNQAQE